MSGAAAWNLSDARVPACLIDERIAADAEGLARVDLIIRAGRVAALRPAGSLGPPTDLGAIAAFGGIVVPCFVDAHVHLDKGHIWPRAPNPDGSFMSALTTVGSDRAVHWSAPDLLARMTFGLQCAYAHGTRALRTHLDSVGPQTRITWPVFAELRAAWSGRVELHSSPLFGIEHALDEAHMRGIENALTSFGGPRPTIGAVTYMAPELQPGLDRLFRLASDKGWDLDFHVDESSDPAAHALRVIAETALRFKFPHRLLAGHCCSLALQPHDEAARTIALVAAAGMSVVSLPMCNLYLQDRRHALTPRWRGVTALHELKAAGVNVMIASDNTRDPFYAYGDLDMFEVWREGARILHLDHPFGDWAASVTSAPAAALGLAGVGRIEVGAPADFVLFRARSMTELFARPQADRAVFRDGLQIDTALPDYSDLDHLHGLAR